MSDNEKLKTAENIKIVEPGKSFQISIDLEAVVDEDENNITLAPQELEIVGIGRGRIIARKAKDFTNKKYNGKSNAPTGVFDVRFEQVGKEIKPDPKTLPLTIELQIDGLRKKQLTDEVTAYLISGDEEFEGKGDYDENKLGKEGKARLNFTAWVKEGDEETEFSFFHPWVFDDISLQINP